MILSMPMQIQLRNVCASNDSTVVYFSEVEHRGLTVNVPFKKMILRNGRDIKSVYDYQNKIMKIPDFKKRNFVATGQSKVIMGFRCDEYKTEEENVQIWVTQSLPSYINPGVANVNVNGAILRFIISSPAQTIISTLTKIESE